jgi:hypothetical protein
MPPEIISRIQGRSRPPADSATALSNNNRVPPEFMARARGLRTLIERSTDEFETLVDRVLRPLQPRPGWPEPGRGNWYKGLVARYRAIKSPCRLDLSTTIEPDGSLTMLETTAVASRIARPDWESDEPAISVEARAVGSHPFRVERSLLADVGLHALARRYQRGWAIDDGSVLLDLTPLGYRWASTVKAGGEFRIDAPQGDGEWLGTVTEVEGRLLPVLMVRTFK